MRKSFIYFESQQGGMGEHHISDPSSELASRLYGWFTSSVIEEDQLLLRWAETCKVGEYQRHRLGTLVRVIGKA